MQAFFFLSGYFSKKPERGREIAVKALLWPLLMTYPFFMIIQFVIDYDLKFNILQPPFAMWFLLCLFYYRMFHKDYIKIKHLFGIVFLLSLVVGVIPSFSATLSFKMAGISWWSNIIVHLAVFVVSIAFMIVLFNVFGNKKGYWSYIGQHTMPIYIFHIVIFHLICRNGLGFGLFTPPAYDTPLYLLYVLVLAAVVTTVLATPPFVWLYDVIFGKSYDLFIKCFHRFAEPAGAAVEKALLAVWPFKTDRADPAAKQQD